MGTTPKIRITRAEDLVAYLPYQLGFRPRDSVVLLGMGGPRRPLGLVSRVDLADIGHPETGRGIVREMAWLMAKDGSEDVLVVLYSDLPRGRLHHDPLVRGALDNLRALTGWCDPPGPWVVGARTYGCWGGGEECAPATGAVAELEEGPLAATMVLHGFSVAADRGSLTVPRSTDAGRRRTATRSARDARRRHAEVRARCGGGAASLGAALAAVGTAPAVDEREMEEWREAEWRRWGRLVALARAGAHLPAAELGRLAVGLEDNTVRDGVLCSFVRELPRLPDAPLAAATLDLAMLAGGPSPDHDRVEPASVVLRGVVACTPQRSGALALGLLAWVSWWCADGARADVLAQQALRARPGTRLAELVDQALAARLPPGWARGAAADEPGARGTVIR